MGTNKPHLVFACRWNKEIEKTWSGSAYAVFQQLNHYFAVERLDIKDTISVRLFKLMRKFHIVHGDPSLLSVIRTYNRKYKKAEKESNIIFQFDETPWTSRTKNYIYQDLSVSYICYMREHDPVAYSYSGFSNIPKGQLIKREKTQKDFYEHCSGIFTMGRWLADFMVKECGIPKEKIHVVGAGINVPVGPEDYSQKRGNKILFVGKDFERKGGKLVVEAFRILRKKYRTDAELYIVGPEENPLKEEISGVNFVGNMDKERVADYFKMCDVFCMPSYFEAFGIAFCEALANGLPCIARNKYAMAEIIHDGEDGYLIDEDDTEVLAQKMDQLLANNQIFQTVRSKRNEYIKKYSWENVVEKMQSVICGDD